MSSDWGQSGGIQPDYTKTSSELRDDICGFLFFGLLDTRSVPQRSIESVLSSFTLLDLKAMAEYLTTLQTAQLASAIHLTRRQGSIDEQEIWLFFVESLSRLSKQGAKEDQALPVFKILLSASAFGSRAYQRAFDEEDTLPCDDFLHGDSMVQQILHEAGLDTSQTEAKSVLPPLDTQRSQFFELLSSNENGFHTKDVQGRTALSQAAAMGFDRLVRVLLSHGCDADSRDLAGRSPLMLASINGYGEVAYALFSHGAYPSWQDNEGMTALSHAASSGHQMVSRLVRYGCRLDHVDFEGMTPLCRAISNGHENTVRELVRAPFSIPKIARDSSMGHPNTADPAVGIDPSSWAKSQLRVFLTEEKLAEATKILAEALRTRKEVIAYMLLEAVVPSDSSRLDMSLFDVIDKGRQCFMNLP